MVPMLNRCRQTLSQIATHEKLVLVQPRKTRPYITERLLVGRKELNQTKLPMR